MKRRRRNARGAAPEIRVGADLVNVASIGESIDHFGERYLGRVFTTGEIEYCERSPSERLRRFAARFAAKEAVLKVLRPHGHWLDWRSIEIVRTASGWCEVRLHGAARLMALKQGLSAMSVSLSHEDQYAMAVVSGTFE